MRVAIYLPWLCSLLLAGAGPGLAVRLAPGRAAWSLVVAAAASAVASTWSLVLMAATLLRDTSPVIDDARHDGIRLPDPIPALIATAALVAIAVGAWRLTSMLRLYRGAREEVHWLCERHSSGTELVVVDTPQPHAFAAPGRTPRIVVTTGMLRALTAAERRVLLAHERAHLCRGHHRFQAVMDAAAAVNPVLVPVRRAVTFLLERWADEDAAAEVGSRMLAARSLARAALASTSRPVHSAAFAESGVIRRVRALQAAPPPSAPLSAALLALAAGTLCVLVGAAVVDATTDFVTIAATIAAR